MNDALNKRFIWIKPTDLKIMTRWSILLFYVKKFETKNVIILAYQDGGGQELHDLYLNMALKK